MAALGKIRSKGAILVIVIGLGLFAFIAEELVRSCESTRNQNRQKIGEVLGKKLDVNEYQKLVDEYVDMYKFTQGRDNLSEAELNQVKDAVWNTFVQSTIINDEAEKVGLTVTDNELQAVLTEGTNETLLQTPFVNQQTGRFDANTLKKFLAEYQQALTNDPQTAEQYRPIYNFWTFVEKNLRQQLLMQKYQALLANCLMANPVSAQMYYDGNNEESSILLATMSYASVNDNDVEISDADIQAKYNELKAEFKQIEETRNIKYVSYVVKASATDRQALDKQIADASAELATAGDPASVLRKVQSSVPYIGVPQTKDAFQKDIADRLDSIAVGQVTAPREYKRDNTINVIRLLSKQMLPDSIEFRVIQVVEEDLADTRTLADSIYTALKGGADFEAIAKKYGQTGEKTWMTSRMYQNASSMDKDTRSYITKLNVTPEGEIVNLELSTSNVVFQVTGRRALVQKYDVAVIKKSIDFSKDTYSTAYNKFSQFVSENTTADAMEKAAAKYGYKVQERKSLSNTAHYIGNINGTREALKWTFEAKAGEVSPLYECGNNDCLLVVMLGSINPRGFLTLDNADVKEYVRNQAMNDKKAELIEAKLQGVNSIDAAKEKGARIDTLKQITFGAPVFVRTAGASEPSLSGAVAATDKGKFSAKPVKGDGGVYLFSVIDKTKREAADEYDEKECEEMLQQRYIQRAGSFMRDLYLNANVVDNRYLFF